MYELKFEQLNEIKKSLKNLYLSLKGIPESRNIQTTVKVVNTYPELYLYKPRFIPSFKSLPREIGKNIGFVMDQINRKFALHQKSHIGFS